jgi:hypothetical protein
MRPFNFSGVWWLPGETIESAVHGTLTYSSDTDVELRLFGDSAPGIEVGEYARDTVCGITDDGKSITLLKCVKITHRADVGNAIDRAWTTALSKASMAGRADPLRSEAP